MMESLIITLAQAIWYGKHGVELTCCEDSFSVPSREAGEIWQ